MPQSGKECCMSLDVVERAGTKPAAAKMVSPTVDKRFTTHDIDGAQPSYPWKNYMDRPSFSALKDIPESKPPALYAHKHRTVDLSMTTSDIDWARPKVNRFKTSRLTNPMDPAYKLPSAVPFQPEIPYYSGRPTLDVSDIDGSSPKVLFPGSARSERDAGLPYVGRRVRHTPLRDTLDVSDIKSGDKKVIRPRLTNPLEPVYIIDQRCTCPVSSTWKSTPSADNLTPLIAGVVQFSKPRKLFEGEPHSSASLDNSDICGSNSQRFAGTLPINIYSKLNTGKSSGSITTDIPGAQPGTLQRGLRTKRRTNPLDPQYNISKE